MYANVLIGSVRAHKIRASRFLQKLAQEKAGLFAHWRLGMTGAFASRCERRRASRAQPSNISWSERCWDAKKLKLAATAHRRHP
jgi:hypothetical protein